MMLMASLVWLVALLAPVAQDAESRTWKAGKAAYSIKGELFAYNDTTVVIKRTGSEKLVAMAVGA